jgi:hypothetical protein
MHTAKKFHTTTVNKVKVVYPVLSAAESIIKELCDELDSARLQLEHTLTLHTKYLNTIKTKE